MDTAAKIAVITGAGSGIGRALARRFAAEGPETLVVADINLEAAEATAREVGGHAVRADVGREDEISPVAEAEVMQRAIPRSTLSVIAGAGHLSSLEQPDMFSRALSDFLLGHL